MPSIDQLPPLPVGSINFNELHDAVSAKKPDMGVIDALYVDAAQRPDLLPQVIEAQQAAAAEAAAETPAAPVDAPADAGAVQEN